MDSKDKIEEEPTFQIPAGLPHWRVFSPGDVIELSGYEFRVKAVTHELLVLRPLRAGEKIR